MTRDKLLQTSVANISSVKRKRPSLLSHIDSLAGKVSCGSLGWLPWLCLTTALGLLLLAFADAEARTDAQWAASLFWIGLLVLFAPITARLVSQGATRQERIALLSLLGVGLYLAKILHSPTDFAFHDEFLHWRTAMDVNSTNHLFSVNSLLPVSPLYPGLEIVTNAIQTLTGLSTFNAAVVIIGVARLVLVLSVYLLYEQISSSVWIAGIGTLVYITNEHFLFFDAMYSYESLALPLATVVLLAVAKRAARINDYTGLNLVIVLGVGTVVITHHLTSFALTAFLVLWAILPIVYRGARDFFFWYMGTRTPRELIWGVKKNLTSGWNHLTDDTNPRNKPGPGWTAVLSLVAVLGWLVYVASLIIGYLSPIFVGAVRELFQLIAAEGTTRAFFQDYAGQVVPTWERLVSIVAVILTVLMIPTGAVQIWRRYRPNALAAVMVLGSVAYPVVLALRLTKLGADVENRSTAFLYLPIGFVVALGLARFCTGEASTRRSRFAITVLIAAEFVGGIIAGAGPIWVRLPGPYLVSADARSIEPIGISAAEWARSYLGPNNRMATDRINRLLMGTYGAQHLVTNVGDRVDVSPLFFSIDWDANDQSIIRRGKIRYLVIDQRLSTGLPRLGIYFEEGEPDAYQHTSPIALAALTKFDGVRSISRIFDSGNLVIYDVGELADGSS